MGYNKVITTAMREEAYLAHHGVIGMKWGVRRYQNKDGSLTPQGQARMDKTTNKIMAKNEAKKKQLVSDALNRSNTTLRDEIASYPEPVYDLYKEMLISKVYETPSKELNKTKSLDEKHIWDKTIELTKKYAEAKTEFDKLPKRHQKLLESNLQIYENASIAQWYTDHLRFPTDVNMQDMRKPEVIKQLQDTVNFEIDGGFKHVPIVYPDPKDYERYKD